MNLNWLALLCPFGLLVVGVIVSGLLSFLAYRSGGKKVKPARVVKCKVAEMRDGVCRVRGRLVAREEPLISPLTDKTCLYFHFKVEQAYEIKTWTTRYGGVSALAGGGESTSEHETWHTIIDDVQRIAVAIEDDTGRAYLDLADAQFDDVTVKKEGVIDTSQAGGLAFEMMLQKRYGESTLVERRSRVSSSFSRRTSRMSQGRELPKATVLEEVIENGLEVVVVGEVETREGRSPRFRPVDHPLIVAAKARRAELPTPTNPAVGLWIAAGAVLGVAVFLALAATFVICAGAVPIPNPRVLPPQFRPAVGH